MRQTPEIIGDYRVAWMEKNETRMAELMEELNQRFASKPNVLAHAKSEIRNWVIKQTIWPKEEVRA